MFIKTNVPNYMKDPNTNVVINTSDEYDKMKAERKRQKEMHEMKSRMGKLENDISDIKNLLIQLANGKK